MNPQLLQMMLSTPSSKKSDSVSSMSSQAIFELIASKHSAQAMSQSNNENIAVEVNNPTPPLKQNNFPSFINDLSFSQSACSSPSKKSAKLFELDNQESLIAVPNEHSYTGGFTNGHFKRVDVQSRHIQKAKAFFKEFDDQFGDDYANQGLPFAPPPPNKITKSKTFSQPIQNAAETSYKINAPDWMLEEQW